MGRSYYVSPQGDDRNPGSETQPWKSLATLKNRVQGGDTVTLEPGTWRDPLPLVSGLTVRAREPGRAVIDGSATAAFPWVKGPEGIWRAVWPGTPPAGLFFGTYEQQGAYCCAYDGRYAQFDPSRPGGRVVAGSKSQWMHANGVIQLTSLSGGDPGAEGLVIADGDGAITLDGLSDVHLDGIMTRYWRYAVGSKGGKNIALTGCRFEFNAQTGVWLTGIDGVELSGSVILGGGSMLAHAEDCLHLDGGKAKISGNEVAWGGHGLAFCDHSGSFTFQGNHLHDSGGSGITLARGVNDVVIDGNWIARCATQRSPSVRDVGAALQLHGDRHQVRGNHLEKNSKHVLLQSEGKANPSSSDCLFERNTLLDAEENSVEYQELASDTGQLGRIQNNTFRDCIISGAGQDLLSLWFAGQSKPAVGRSNTFQHCQLTRGRIRGSAGTFATVEEARQHEGAVYVASQSAPLASTGSSLTAPPVTGAPPQPPTPPGGTNPPPTSQKPLLAALTPSSGLPGAVVTASGSGFGSDPAVLVPVPEGARRLTGLGGNDRSVTFTMPVDAVTGEVRVRRVDVTPTQLSEPLTFTVTGTQPPPPPPPPPPPSELRVTISASVNELGASFSGSVQGGGPLPAGSLIQALVTTPDGRSGNARVTIAGDAPPPPIPPIPTDPEAEVLRRVNAERAANGGLAPLALNAKLHAAAVGHAQWMASVGRIDHTGANGSTVGQRIEAQGYHAVATGECIASGYENATSVMAGWMASPPHRSILLGAGYTEIGVVMARAADGRTYWCLDVAMPTAGMSPISGS